MNRIYRISEKALAIMLVFLFLSTGILAKEFFSPKDKSEKADEHNRIFTKKYNAFDVININGDTCEIALTISCGDTLTGSTTGATDAEEELPCSGGPGSGDIAFNVGVWYTFIGSGDSMTISTDNPGTDFDTELQLWRGECGALTCIGGDDDGGSTGGGGTLSSEMTFLSELDSTYHVYVDGHGSTATGNYALSLECKAPSNDLQANAIQIDCNTGSIDGQTISATNMGEPATCVITISAPGIWYSIDGIDTDITLDLCSAPFDSKINVYEDTGSGLTCIFGEDDDFTNCGGNDPHVTFASELGKTYLIYVQGFDGQTGSFTLNISCECSGLVINTNDSGYGSLRDNVACAMSGDTIRFDAGIDGDSIKLTSGQIPISGKTLTFLGNGQDDTKIDGSLDSLNRLFNIQSGADVTFRNLTIQNGGGPTLSDFGGAILMTGSSNLNLVNCAISGNQTDNGSGGGAILFLSGTGKAINCVFAGNRSNAGRAGTIYIQGNTQVELTQCLFINNYAANLGACLLAGQSENRYDITNCTFVQNESGTDHSVIYQQAGATTNLYNNIFYRNNGAAAILQGGTIVNAENNIVDIPGLIVVGSDGNVIADPLFADMGNGDYSILNNSPAIDAGDNSFLPVDSCDIDGDGNATEQVDIDLNGDARVFGCRVDIGAYENSNSGRSLLVRNTNDNGAGSLRDAIACAFSGDTIRFDSSINGDTIKVFDFYAVFNKTIVIQGNGVHQTIVDGSMNVNTTLFASQFSGNLTLNNLTLQDQDGTFILLNNTTSRVSVNNCEIHGGTFMGVDQANLFVVAGMLTLTNCIIYDNENTTSILRYQFANGAITIDQCLFYSNNSPFLIQNTNSPLSVLNIYQSTMIHEATMIDNVDSLNLLNNVIHTHATAGTNNVIFETNQNNLINNLGDIPLGTDGNIEAYAQFADTANADYSLTACSPGVNTGFDDGFLPATDLDGNNRFVSWTVDRGAYEYGGAPCDTGQCSLPIVLECGVLYSGTTAQGGDFFDGYSCTTDGESGPDIVHEIDVPVAGDITITLNDMSTGGNQDVDILLLSACDPDSCIDFDAGATLIVTVNAGTYYLIVDGYDGGAPGTDPSFGAYEVTVDCPTSPGPCTENIVNVLKPTSPMGLYHAMDVLNSDATVTTSGVEFKAGNEINLDPDFEVQLGNEFDAIIEPCPPPLHEDGSARKSGNKFGEKLEARKREQSRRVRNN